MAKATIWPATDAQSRKRGEQIGLDTLVVLSLIHISEPTRQEAISYAVFCLKKKTYKINLLNEDVCDK